MVGTWHHADRREGVVERELGEANLEQHEIAATHQVSAPIRHLENDVQRFPSLLVKGLLGPSWAWRPGSIEQELNLMWPRGPRFNTKELLWQEQAGTTVVEFRGRKPEGAP